MTSLVRLDDGQTAVIREQPASGSYYRLSMRMRCGILLSAIIDGNVLTVTMPVLYDEIQSIIVDEGHGDGRTAEEEEDVDSDVVEENGEAEESDGSVLGNGNEEEESDDMGEEESEDMMEEEEREDVLEDEEEEEEREDAIKEENNDMVEEESDDTLEEEEESDGMVEW